MANNYSEFSFDLTIKNETAKSLIQRLLEFIEDGIENFIEDESLRNLHNNQFADMFSMELVQFHKDPGKTYIAPIKELISSYEDEEAYSLGFSYTLYRDSIVFYSEESGELSAAAQVASYLMEFGLVNEEHRVAQAAFTCSKPRVDEFGGEAVLIAASAVKYMPSADIWGNRELCKLNKCFHKLSALIEYLEELVDYYGHISRIQESTNTQYYLIETRTAYIMWSCIDGAISVLPTLPQNHEGKIGWLFDMSNSTQKHTVFVPCKAIEGIPYNQDVFAEFSNNSYEVVKYSYETDSEYVLRRIEEIVG